MVSYPARVSQVGYLHGDDFGGSLFQRLFRRFGISRTLTQVDPGDVLRNDVAAYSVSNRKGMSSTVLTSLRRLFPLLL